MILVLTTSAGLPIAVCSKHDVQQTVQPEDGGNMKKVARCFPERKGIVCMLTTQHHIVGGPHRSQACSEASHDVEEGSVRHTHCMVLSLGHII